MGSVIVILNFDVGGDAQPSSSSETLDRWIVGVRDRLSG